MKTSHLAALLAQRIVILLLLLCAVSPAQAFWGSSHGRRVDEADKLMEKARKAEEEQRIMDACDAYSQAHELYRKVQMDSPKTRADHVARQNAECRARLRTLFARAASGQVTMPSPEEIMPSMTTRRLPAEALDGTIDEHAGEVEEPAFEDEDSAVASASVDVDAEEDPVAADDTEVPSSPTKRRSRTWLGRTLFGEDSGTESLAAEGPAVGVEWEETAPTAAIREHPPASEPAPRRTREPPETVAADTASGTARDVRIAGISAGRTPSDSELSRTVQAMLEEGAGADAVMMLEEIVEASPAPTLTQQLLFVQALMSRRNYTRAQSVLEPLEAAHSDNPSVRMLASGLAMAQGRPIVALRILDALVRDYPRYADAYINLAYTRFAMDPAANRNEAVLYYRHALSLGARRDPRLETELRVDVD